MRILLFGVIYFVAAAFARIEAAGPAKLAGVEVYGSDRFTGAEVSAKFGDQINKFFRKRQSRYPAEQRESAALQKQIEDGVRREWRVPWVRLTWMDAYTVDEHNVYLTFDVVEKNDLKNRMPFTPAPKKKFSDPNALVAAWTQYTELGWSLVRTGQLNTDRPNCPSLFCLWGSQTSDLRAYEDRFVQFVPANKTVLGQMITEDKDPVHRANAIYLMGYANDSSGLPRTIQPALKDPDMEVRGAALRVYSDLAVYHKEIFLPVDQIAAALDYPTVEDRNKALAVITAMADNPQYQSYLTHRGAPMLLKLLHSIQPANHDLAFSALGILSKQNYGAQDYSAWQQWISRAQAELDAQNKKK